MKITCLGSSMDIFIDERGVEFNSPDYPNCRVTGSCVNSCQDCNNYKGGCQASLENLKEARMYILAYITRAEEVIIDGSPLSEEGRQHLIGFLKAL